jgi:uncharacterized membrane protein YbaN (DUF454 family)
LRKASVVKWILRVIGIISVGLGVLGVFVPLLPTTPFLLLAAACFFHSSPRLYAWLIHHRWFGKYIRYYRECQAIPLRAKIVSLVLLWSVIGYTAWRVVTAWWIRAGLGVIALGVTLHLLRLQTLTQEMIDQVEEAAQAQSRTAAGAAPDRQS